ncbi:MAG: PaaI family thioesterase [Pseudomonadota bacterium]
MMHRGEMPPPAMGVLMNMDLHEVEEGRVLFSGIADDRHLNPMGGVHGGYSATLLDSACGSAVLTTLPEGKLYTTIDLALKIMRPVPTGQRVLCEGKVQRPGRTVAFVEGWLRTENGRLLAHATSSCAVFDAPMPR